ncbi:MAG TPA: ATP-binding protein [Chloroflexota bacterium]|nr:ATP-binding protein [Chloroflexota bacterium]
METISSSPSGPSSVAESPAGRACYGVSEAAALLGVSRVSIWRWIRAGRLPAARLGHRITRIKREDLERLLGQAVQSAAEPGENREGMAGPWVTVPEMTGMALEDREALALPGLQVAPGLQPKTGVPDHVAHFYETDASLLEASGEFIAAGLVGDDAALVVTTPNHREGIEERLRAAGLDVDALRAGGRYLSLDAAETLSRFIVDGAPVPRRFAEVLEGLIRGMAADGRHVRIYGDMAAILMAQGNHAASVGLEELWNDLQQALGFSLMCGYPLGVFGEEAFAEVLDKVCAAHSLVLPTERYGALGGEDERRRAITLLQQQARSLQAEIAQRRWAEQRLRGTLASEQRKERVLSDFVETAPLGMHWVGPDGTVLWANRAEMDMLGYGPEEYIGRHIATFHADQDTIEDILARLKSGETLREYPARLRCKDGSIRHVLIDSSVLRENGRFVHTRCFTRDVTALRRAAEERAALLERERAARREAQQAAERTRRLLEITRQLGTSLEADQVLEAIARSASDLLQVPVGAVFLLDPADPEGDFQLAAAHGIHEARSTGLRLPRRASLAGRAVDEGQTLVVDDVRGTPGTTLPMLLTGETAGSEIVAPITAGGVGLGVIKAFSATLRRFSPDDADLLTALAAAAAAALNNARLYQQAQQALHQRDTFLASASHDLKNPLTAVKGQAQLLRRTLARATPPAAPDDPTRHRLQEGLIAIERQTMRMVGLLDELLDLTRLELGQDLTLDRKAVDLVTLVEQLMDEHQEISWRHRLRLVHPQEALVGQWDAARLERVLLNLIDNAVKYSPDGSEITVELSAEPAGHDEAPSDRQWAVIRVSDQGIGIPAADVPHIFERFRRASNTSGRIQGTGIGLATAKHIVEQHGGQISVMSEEGHGSTFTVRLPLPVSPPLPLEGVRVEA